MNNNVMNQISEALVEALNGKNGPLIIGVTAIVFLVFSFKIIDNKYGIELNGVKIQPTSNFSLDNIRSNTIIGQNAI